MLRVGNYLFKRAETSNEFEQIHRLNHRTFVDEIPQHQSTTTGLLVDKFHHKNAYLVVLRDDRVVGMVSAHDEQPFSVADRLPDPSILSKPGTRPLEVRLLAIEPDERNSTMFFGLIWSLYEYAQNNGYTHLFISGVANRVPLYKRLGLVPLGPAVQCGKASFVPMVLAIGQLPHKIEQLKKAWEGHLGKLVPKRSQSVCLLPGPVTMSRLVCEAFSQPPIYHRGPEFIGRFLKTRGLLGEIVGGRDVAILNGSGTLANETIAATLAAGQRQAEGRTGKGVLLINGEFGERLARQATRFGLEPRQLTWAWGKPWDLDEVDAALAQEPEGSWIWGVHQESSTGVLNDLPGLVRIARKHGIRVCVDCISSLGAVPIDLADVYLASGATGKSLGSYAGAALIFANRAALDGLDRRQIPSYLDLYAALCNDGPCYTFPSPTHAALEAALEEYSTPQRANACYAHYHELGVRVRQVLRRLDLTPLAAEKDASPVVTTFSPPGDDSSESFVNRCLTYGYAIGGESTYLSRRRFVQIATMGAVRWEMFAGLFDRLESWLAKRAFMA